MDEPERVSDVIGVINYPGQLRRAAGAGVVALVGDATIVADYLWGVGCWWALQSVAAGLDATMAGCILALYRSAVDVGRDWAPGFHYVPAPGFTVVPSEDPFLLADSAPERRPPRQGERGRHARSRALVVLQDPAGSVGILERFWAELEQRVGEDPCSRRC